MKNGRWIKRKIVLLVIVVLLIISGLRSCFNGGSSESDDIGTEKYVWPGSEIANMLPKPESEYGKIEVDSEDSFMIKIGKTDGTQYNNYVASCKENGFTVDYYGTDSSYSAENENGYSLMIDYDNDQQIMDISIDAPVTENASTAVEATTVQATTAAKESTTKATTATKKKTTEKKKDTSSSFRQMMDEYEDFIDEYVSFMKKYENSDDTTAMLADYTKFMTEYAEYVEKLDDVEEDDVSASDWAYYLEVMTRCNEKMAELATE